MITNNLAILTYNKITTVGIISACPFFGRRHSKRSIEEKNFHFVGIESLHVFAVKFERILFCHFRNTLIN